MTTCCFMTLMTVLAVIGIICIIAILAMAFVIHLDLRIFCEQKMISANEARKDISYTDRPLLPHKR